MNHTNETKIISRMNAETEWYRKIAEQIAEHNISSRDYKFFQIERFLRAVRRLEHYSENENCIECNYLKNTAEDIALNLEEYINGKRAKKIEFEKKFDKILHHLKQRHRLTPYSYFVAIYSLIGMLAGAAIGALIGMLISPVYMKVGGLVGWAIGLITGRLFGSRKDRFKLKSNSSY